jgi:uncharacterized membrane protein YfcA
VTRDLLLLAAVGFVAQLIDGALGMAFGLISTSFMLGAGLPPAYASAVVHTAEVATTAVSGASHLANRNVDRGLFLRLALAGVAGGVLGAYVLSNVEGKAIRPFIAAYLLVMGCLILMRAARALPLEDARPGYAPPLGLVGGFLDAIGGGGWGPLVTSTLIGSGQAPRKVIGSVNLAEFFITTAVATTFFAELGAVYLPHVLALGAGGVLAAPLAGFAVKHTRPRLLLGAVGVLVTGLALRDLAMAVGRWAP